MDDLHSIRFLWQYMVFADAQIQQAADTLSDEGYRREQNMSFGSVEKLIHHAIMAQTTWLQRLNGLDVAYADVPPFPRDVVAGHWAQLHQQLLAFVDAQTPASLQTIVRSRTRSGQRFEMPTWALMHHVADHATYHRGQLNSMIKLAGGKPSSVMLYTYCAQHGIGKQLPPIPEGPH
jgi:uncharacterized damage-inducible protein DinB